MGKVAGGDSILGMAAAAAIAVPLGVVVALPALRLQGLYLALVTFALAQVSRDVIFQDTRIYGLGGVEVGRLEIFGVDFSGDQAFAVLCGIVFALVGVGVLALRRGSFGRRLAAMRDSQAACATLGMDVRRTKLAVFALSSAIAGLAGALHGGLGFTAGQLDFEPLFNVLLFLFAFVGGITTVTGALLGGHPVRRPARSCSPRRPSSPGLVFAVIAVTALALGQAAQRARRSAVLVRGASGRWLPMRRRRSHSPQLMAAAARSLGAWRAVAPARPTPRRPAADRRGAVRHLPARGSRHRARRRLRDRRPAARRHAGARPRPCPRRSPASARAPPATAWRRSPIPAASS